MNEKQRAVWRQRRQRGKSSYLLTFGVLPWAIGFTLLFSLVELIYQHEMNWTWVPIRLIIFAMAGFFFANSRWQSLERQYENVQK